MCRFEINLTKNIHNAVGWLVGFLVNSLTHNISLYTIYIEAKLHLISYIFNFEYEQRSQNHVLVFKKEGKRSSVRKHTDVDAVIS